MRKVITGSALALIFLPIAAFALNTVATGWRVEQTAVEIDAHGICKNVVSNTSADYFVPTKTASEWSNFLANKPSAVGASDCSSCGYQSKRLFSGYFGGCAIKVSDNTLQCWNSFDGQSSAPLFSGTFDEIVDNGSGGAVCGLRTNGTVVCWNSAPSNVPQIVAPSGTFKSLAAQGANFCGIRSDDTVTCWGEYKSWSDSGHGPGAYAPSGTFKSVVNDFMYSCGLRTNNSVTCWGSGAPSAGTYAAINSVSGARSIHIFNNVMSSYLHVLCVIDASNTATCANGTITSQFQSHDVVDIVSDCAVTTAGRQICHNGSSFQNGLADVGSIDTDDLMWDTCALQYDGAISCASLASASVKNALKCQ